MKPHGRTPANVIAEQKIVTRQHVWAMIRQLKIFETSDIIVELDNSGLKTNDNTVKDYIFSLRKAGYIEVKQRTRYKGGLLKVIYELVKDAGIEAPTINRDGSPSKSHTATDNMWRSMKMIGVFDYRDLLASAGTKNNELAASTVKTYITRLTQAGYLAVVKPSTQKPIPTPAKYKLLASKNTGPKAPQIQRTKQVFDPNLNRVMYAEVVE